ncbi:hypothetical protein GQ600_13603 [Phytophthora cactorum]|nr:hypothetical protein GQ600_13603 [Phytophthora cactorum]
MVVKLIFEPQLQGLVQHAAKMNKQDPAGEMLTALTNVLASKNLATMILLGEAFVGIKQCRQEVGEGAVQQVVCRGQASNSR